MQDARAFANGSAAYRQLGAQRRWHVHSVQMWTSGPWSGILTAAKRHLQGASAGRLTEQASGTLRRIGLRRSTRSPDRSPKEGVRAQGSVAGISGLWAGGLQEIVPADAGDV